MHTQNERNSEVKFLFLGTVFVSVLFLTAGLLVFALCPSVVEAEPVVIVQPNAFESLVAQAEPEEDPFTVQVPLTETKLTINTTAKKADSGLTLYRNPSSRLAVEWFYTHITNSRDVALAILDAADQDEIPVSLAFALAYTESRYDVRAVNTNTNGSVDRGLFQLNNRSFTKLREDEFFDPAVSAQYGMAHLRFCLNSAGNEVAALAMYNAGANKVRNNSTPQTTLNYVSKIISYKAELDALFAGQVAVFYNVDNDTLVAKN